MEKLIIIFGIILTTLGCGGSFEEIYLQKIPNSSKVIYDYSIWSGRDSHFSGYAVLDSAESPDQLPYWKIPIEHLTFPPNKESIKGINSYSNDKLIFTGGKEIEFDKIKGINFEIIEYPEYPAYSHSGCGLSEYEFKSFEEKGDSLIFLDLKRNFSSVHDKNIDLSKKAFLKGNIKVFSDSSNYIRRIEVKEILFHNLIEGQVKRSNKKIGDSTAVCSKTYYFLPDSKMQGKDFSNYGIFKRLK